MASLLTRYFEDPPGLPRELHRFYQLALYVYPVGFLFHHALIFAFWALGLHQLALFNVGSAGAWLLALLLHRRRMLYAAVSIVILEAVAYSVYACAVVGLEGRYQYLLAAVVSGVFLVHGARAFRFVVAAACAAIFVALYLYFGAHPPSPPVSGGVIRWLAVSNIVQTLLLLALFSYYYNSIAARAEAALAAEHARSERLLHNILPVAIAERLKAGDKVIADGFADASVLFADIVGFTPLSEKVSPQELVHLLDEVVSHIDDLAAKHGLEKIKTIGDAYMVAAGIPEPRPDHAAALADFALELNTWISSAEAQHHGHDLQLRIGINSGPVVAGVIGKQKFSYDLWGDCVNTAARMESHGLPGEIQITAATRQRLGQAFRCEARGELEIKGKGAMTTYLLRGRATAG